MDQAAGGLRDRGTELLATVWVFTVLSTIVVALKLFTRVHIISAVGLDDFFIFLSLALALIASGLLTYAVSQGLGQHASVLPFEGRVLAVKYTYIANPFGIMAYSFPNISVAILLDRLLVLKRVQKWGLYGLVISQCVSAALSNILLFAQCTPSEYLWDPTVELYSCLPSQVITGFSYFVGTYSAFTDIVLAVIPIVAFWNLNMKLKTKIGVSLLMSLTLLAAICAIVKTTKLNELANLADFTSATVDLVIWAMVEANVIIMAASIPSLRPFINSVTSKHATRGDVDLSLEDPMSPRVYQPHVVSLTSTSHSH